MVPCCTMCVECLLLSELSSAGNCKKRPGNERRRPKQKESGKWRLQSKSWKKRWWERTTLDVGRFVIDLCRMHSLSFSYSDPFWSISSVKQRSEPDCRISPLKLRRLMKASSQGGLSGFVIANCLIGARSQGRKCWTNRHFASCHWQGNCRWHRGWLEPVCFDLVVDVDVDGCRRRRM